MEQMAPNIDAHSIGAEIPISIWIGIENHQLFGELEEEVLQLFLIW